MRLKEIGIVAALATVTLAATAVGQPPPPSAAGDEPVRRVYTLRHQPVREAVTLIFPLLSERGSVEVQPGGNTLVIRDTPAALARILALLDDFDQPGQSVRLEIRIVSAGLEDEEGAAASELPAELVERLRQLLRYRSYRLLAGLDLEVREGGLVRRDLGEGYRVDFRMGRLEPDRRIKLLGFRMHRRDRGPEAEPLIFTNINLRLDKPMVLGLARTESSASALMVVLSCSTPPASKPSESESRVPGREAEQS